MCGQQWATLKAAGAGTLLSRQLFTVCFCFAACTIALDVDGIGREDPLRTAMRHATGLSDDELTSAAEELLQLSPPSKRQLWNDRVHCQRGKCIGEALARLISILGEGKRLPLRFFEPAPDDPIFNLWHESDQQELHSWQTGVDHQPKAESYQALMVEGQPLAIGRIQAAEFMLRVKARIIEDSGGTYTDGMLGRCLEWDTPHYIVKAFNSLCWRFDVLTYNAVYENQVDDVWYFPLGSRQLTVDILKPPAWLPDDYGVVVCLFVLEHVADPYLALKNTAKLLRPGGYLILAAPFIDGLHACPDDFFRFSPHAMRKIVDAAGLVVLDSFGPGSPIIAAGELIGMRSNLTPL